MIDFNVDFDQVIKTNHLKNKEKNRQKLTFVTR